MTKQPQWKLIEILGEADWTEGPTYFIFEDETGVYPPELERVVRQNDKRMPYEVRRVLLERCVMVAGRLVVASVGEKILMGDPLPHPYNTYTEWFDKHTDEVASEIGMWHKAYRRMFCSRDTIELARAYIELYDIMGWENGDDYPLYLTVEDAEKRYDTH